MLPDAWPASASWPIPQNSPRRPTATRTDGLAGGRDGLRAIRTYDRTVGSIGFLLLAGLLALLVLIPTRRLYLAGWPTGALFGYFLFVYLLALAVAQLRGPARFLVPLLVIAYLGPFVTAREGIARLMGRPTGGPTVRARPPDVTSLPSPAGEPPDGPSDETLGSPKQTGGSTGEQDQDVEREQSG